MKLHVGILTLAAVLAAGVVRADAQTFYVANMTGARAVPATASGGTGIVRVTLDEEETQLTVSALWFSLTTGSPTVRIHGPAGPDDTAPTLFTLPLTSVGTTGGNFNMVMPVTASQVQDLKAGRWYVNVTNSAFLTGEIRGQVEVSPVFVASLTAAQVVPPVATAATGRAWISLNETNTLALVSMFWRDLSVEIAGARLHIGRPGTDGPFLCDLSMLPVRTGQMIDFPCTLTPAQVAALRAGQVYVIAQTLGIGTELRGQFKRSPNPCDFDGDGRSDQTVVRTSGPELVWWVLLSNGGMMSFPWGPTTDFFLGGRLMCTDFNGDGKAEATIYRPGPPGFFLTRFNDEEALIQQWGGGFDDPTVAGDYDGDGRDDLAIYRQGEGTQGQYWIKHSTDDSLAVHPFGIEGDKPLSVPDTDGDGRIDIVVQRDADHWIRRSSDGIVHVIPFGSGFDATQALDFDGDGRTDLLHQRTVNAHKQWWILGSLTGGLVSPLASGSLFGSAAAPALPTSADYDGDGRAEIAVIQSEPGGSQKFWWTLDVKTGAITVVPWGLSNDQPVQLSYIK